MKISIQKLIQSVHTFDTSIGLERKFEDMSQTKGTPFDSGTYGNSTPEMVIIIITTRWLVYFTMWNIMSPPSWAEIQFSTILNIDIWLRNVLNICNHDQPKINFSTPNQHQINQISTIFQLWYSKFKFLVKLWLTSWFWLIIVYIFNSNFSTKN